MNKVSCFVLFAFCISFVCAKWVQVPNPDTKVWPSPTRNPSSTMSANGMVYVLGGAKSDKERVSTFASFDIANTKWKSLKDAPAAVSGASLWAINNTYLLMAGGRDTDGNIPLERPWFYNVKKNKWIEQMVTLVPPKVYGAPHWTLDGKSCIYGGKTLRKEVSTELWCFCHTNQTWSQFAPYASNGPDGIEDAAFTVVEHQRAVYFFGGETNQENKTNTLYKLDMDQMQWTSFPGSSTSPLWREDATMVTALGARALLMFGGKNKKNTLQDAFLVMLDTMEWMHAHWHIDVSPRWGSTTSRIGQTTAVFGGRDNFDFFSELWIHSGKQIPEPQPFYESDPATVVLASIVLALILFATFVFLVIICRKKKRGTLNAEIEQFAQQNELDLE